MKIKGSYKNTIKRVVALLLAVALVSESVSWQEITAYATKIQESVTGENDRIEETQTEAVENTQNVDEKKTTQLKEAEKVSPTEDVAQTEAETATGQTMLTEEEMPVGQATVTGHTMSTGQATVAEQTAKTEAETVPEPITPTEEVIVEEQNKEEEVSAAPIMQPGQQENSEDTDTNVDIEEPELLFEDSNTDWDSWKHGGYCWNGKGDYDSRNYYGILEEHYIEDNKKVLEKGTWNWYGNIQNVMYSASEDVKGICSFMFTAKANTEKGCYFGYEFQTSPEEKEGLQAIITLTQEYQTYLVVKREDGCAYCYVKGEDGKSYLPHTLNNTVVAPPRMLIAFLENHLQADGSVTIPEVLRPYMGGKETLIPKK